MKKLTDAEVKDHLHRLHIDLRNADVAKSVQVALERMGDAARYKKALKALKKNLKMVSEPDESENMIIIDEALKP